MPEISLEALGFKREEVLEKVVEQIADQLLSSPTFDEDGEPEGGKPSRFAQDVQKRVKARIDQAVAALVDKHVTPMLLPRLETMLLQETTQWGEKKGAPLTFIEWCMKRATDYMTEKVDERGEGRTENNAYNWRGVQPRIQHIVAAGLYGNLRDAVAKTMSEANAVLGKSIETTVKEQLARMVEGLRVTVAK